MENTYRHEKKYILNAMQQQLLMERLRYLMPIDPHAEESGGYHIRSLYFDDFDNSCYYDNENGVGRRKKYRLRIYNRDATRIQLECKHKENDRTYKEAAIITKETAERLIAGEYDFTPETSSLPATFLAESRLHLLKPKVISEYTRRPYVYELGNVRVTFDELLCSSARTEAFFEENCLSRTVFPKGMSLLEVKFDRFIPDFLHAALAIGTLQETAFSKYYYCRKNYL